MKSKKERKIKKLKKKVDTLAGILATFAISLSKMSSFLYTTNATLNLNYKYTNVDGER